MCFSTNDGSLFGYSSTLWVLIGYFLFVFCVVKLILQIVLL